MANKSRASARRTRTDASGVGRRTLGPRRVPRPKRTRPAASTPPLEWAGHTRPELLALATREGVKGRHRMSKAELIRALSALIPPRTSGPAPVTAAPPPGEVAPSRRDEPPAETLPFRYGVTEIVALPVDPFMVYVYWELTADAIAAARRTLGAAWEGSAQVLRAYDVAWIEFDGTNAHHQFDLDVQGEVGNWYLHLWSPEQTLLIEIGWRSRDGRFVAAARSNVVSTPRNAPGEGGEERWMTVRDGRIVTTPSGATPEPSAERPKIDADERWTWAPWSGTVLVPGISSPRGWR
ncbi:MAG: DUF4912 domain-containing protein [Nitrospirae bacterium]|nr:DUF4912 domain-containing protein [Nitrospirota bacterium]